MTVGRLWAKCGHADGVRRIECVEPADQEDRPMGIPSAEAFGVPRVGVRDYMASQHLWTARREAWLCRKREDELLNDRNLDRRHRSHAITAVLSAVAFLEAFVNAVWQDAAESGSLTSCSAWNCWSPAWCRSVTGGRTARASGRSAPCSACWSARSDASLSTSGHGFDAR